jgi:hypothetical protein
MLRILSVFLFIPILFLPLQLYSQGATVSIDLRNGSHLTGELLSVRPDGILLCTVEGLSEKSLPEHQRDLLKICNEDLLRITVQSRSRVLQRTLTGLLFGGGIGFLIGVMGGDDTEGFLRMTALEKGGVGGFLGAAIGIVTGLLFGLADSTPDRMVEPLPGSGFQSIRSASRYPVTEPLFLTTIP